MMVEWADVEVEVAKRLRIARADYEEVEDREDMLRLQARIRAFKEVLALPTYLRTLEELDEEEKGAMTT